MKQVIQCIVAAGCGLALAWLLIPLGQDPEKKASRPALVVTPKQSAVKRATSESPAELLARVDLEGSPDAMWAAIEQTLQIPDNNLADAPQLVLKLSDDDARRWLARGLYTRWAERDAQAAMASARTLPPPLDYTAREAVLLAMCRQDPIATLDLTKEMSPGYLRDKRDCPVLAEWALMDSRSALNHVIEMQRRIGAGAFDDKPPALALHNQTYTVLAVWMERDPAEFAAWFRSLPDGLERRFIARRISSAGERFAPEIAAELALELPGSGIGRRTGYYPVAKTLTDVDQALTMLPAEKWTWETGLVFADMGGGGMREAVAPEEVNRAAASLLERLQEGAAADGVRCGAAIRNADWPAAADAAARFPESSERAAVWQQIVAGWAAIDRTSAEAWLAAQPDGFSRIHALEGLKSANGSAAPDQ